LWKIGRKTRRRSGCFHDLERACTDNQRYSGVTRNPNAYVPPGARRGPVTGPGGAPSRPVLPPTVTSPTAMPKANGTTLSSAPVPAAIPSPSIQATPAVPNTAGDASGPPKAIEKHSGETKTSLLVPPQAIVLPNIAINAEAKVRLSL